MANRLYHDIEDLAEEIKPIANEDKLPHVLQDVLKFKQHLYPEVQNES